MAQSLKNVVGISLPHQDKSWGPDKTEFSQSSNNNSYTSSQINHIKTPSRPLMRHSADTDDVNPDSFS